MSGESSGGKCARSLSSYRKSVDRVHPERLESDSASVLSRHLKTTPDRQGERESSYFREGSRGERGRGVPSCLHTGLLELFDSAVGPSP